MSKILINYPSRSRPDKFMKTIKNYSHMLDGSNDVTFLIKIDADDASMNNTGIRNFLASTGIKYELKVLENCKGKIDAINRHVSEYAWDFVVCIADDISVLVKSWDRFVSDAFAGNYDQCLNYKCDKRVQDFTKLIILPIIGRTLYDRFGYIYHPSYKSEWCDNEQTEVFESLGVLKHIDEIMFDHDWWGNQDALMARNVSVGASEDKQNYLKRFQNKFL